MVLLMLLSFAASLLFVLVLLVFVRCRRRSFLLVGGCESLVVCRWLFADGFLVVVFCCWLLLAVVADGC